MYTLLGLLFALCLVVSFLLSGMEAGVLALNRLRIRHLMRSGNARARSLYAYLEHPENFLWTILVGNTLANILSASIAMLALQAWLINRPLLVWGLFLAGGLLFYAFCELLPKMLFRLYPNRLCMLAAFPFRAIDLALKPLVRILAVFAHGLLGWSGGKRFTGHLISSREEFRSVLQESAQGLTTEERAMINRVLDLQHLSAGHITKPIGMTITVNTETPVSKLLHLSREHGLTRFPVWKKEGSQSRIAGLVNLKSILYRAEVDENKTAGEHLEPAVYLTEQTRLEVALRQLQRTGQRLAIVLGPGGREIGILSLQDILKVIFGEVSL